MLTPTRLEPLLLHEMIHVLGFKRNECKPSMHREEFIAELRRLRELGAGDWTTDEIKRYQWEVDNPELLAKIT